jgi:hypothetical protein
MGCGDLEHDSVVAFFATVQDEGGRLIERQKVSVGKLD